MSDKNREYEEFLKQFEKKYPARSGNDRQRQPQRQYSTYQSVPQRTSQQRVSTVQKTRPTVNDRAYPRSRQHIPQKRRISKKCRQRRLLGISAAVLAIILLVVLFIVIAKSCSSGDLLIGTWDLDGITAYQFDGNGNGSLNLPDNSYSFTYKIKDNSLSIDFESEAARDVSYTFTVREEKLLLVSVEKGKEITYELTKKSGG